MITNPYIGQRVVLLDGNVHARLRAKIATITTIIVSSIFDIQIIFDFEPNTSYFSHSSQVTDVNAPEVQVFLDQMKREEHSLKYL